MTQTFLEERLPVDVSPRVQVTPRFMTSIKQLRGGGEYRNGLWDHPLREYEVQYNARERGRVETELLTFIMRTRGSLNGFRVRDWSDYQATNQFLGVGDGTTSFFPFQKQYGDYSRRISKPDNTTITVTQDGTTVNPNNYFVDLDNGNLVFVNTPPAGATFRWSGEFDVPCRFEDDALSVIMHTDTIASVQSVGLREERTRDNADLEKYKEVRELLRAYDRTDLLAFYDVLDQHVNVTWRDTA